MAAPRPREQLTLSWVIIGLSLAAVVWVALREKDHARAAVAREDLALAELQQVLVAQRTFHTSNERYGWIDELRADGLLQDADVTQYEGRTVIRSPGYRIDVLLPKRKTADGNIRVGLRAGDPVNTRLRAKHFAVVARPVEPGVSGFRVYYLDETGKELVSEGVSDEQARVRNPLPLIHLTASRAIDPGGTNWLPIIKNPN